MAEGLLREWLPSHEIFSAGLCALEGAPADRLALELMWQSGIDISEHRARNLASWSRGCRKNTGPGDENLMVAASMANKGISRINTVSAKPRSNTALNKPRTPMLAG